MMLETRKLLSFHEKLAALSASVANLSDLSRKVLEAILRLVKADSGSIMVYSPVLHRLNLFTSVEHPGEISRRSMAVSEGISGYVFRTKKEIRIEDLKHVPEDLPLRFRERGGSFMSFPLRIAQRTIGIINLNRSPGKPGFSQTDQAILKTVIVQVASIVEKGRLMEEVERKGKDIEGLYSLTNVLYSSEEFGKTLQSFLKKLAGYLGLTRSAILRFSENAGSGEEPFEILSSYNLRKSDLTRILSGVKEKVQGSLALPADVKPGNETGAGDSKAEDESLLALPYLETGKEMDLYCLPLPGKTSTKHFLMVSKGRNLNDPDAVREHHKFLDLAAKQLCVAFERNDIVETIKHNEELLFESAWQNRIYLDISSELASTLDPHLVLRKAFDQFGRLVPFTSIAILLWDDLSDGFQMIIQPYGPISPKYLKALKADVFRIFEHDYHHPLGNPDKIPTQVYSPQHPQLRKVHGFKHMQFLPIVFVEKVMGMLHIANRDDVPPGPKSMEKASQFVGIFVASIKNALIHKQTEKLAYTDPLTGLYNHRYFQETLKKELVRALRYKQPLSLMILDIDFFKKFNDTYGHLVGDKVLIHVGRIFENSVREKIDSVARYGGEEFAVLLPETPLEGALLFAERIRGSVETSPLFTERGDLKVTLSIGVACTLNGKFSTPSDFIAAADKALYEAKEGGRNQVKKFDA